MKDIGNWRHICVDMQRMFIEDTPWRVDWMVRILPQVTEISRRHAEKTWFTRFIPPHQADEAPGAWKDYYRKWWMMTGEHLPPELLNLVPDLHALVPPGTILDKQTYSPWIATRLFADMKERQVRSLVISGGETDVCVLTTILGAIDLGFQVVVLSDAVCSGADQTHDAAIDLFSDRFSSQLTLLDTETFLSGI